MSEGIHPSQSQWLKIGDPKNPFEFDVLDCRLFADTMASSTSDLQVAANFFGLRDARSEELVGQAPMTPFVTSGDFTVACAAPLSNGPIFVAPSMDHKWNLYAHDAKIYARRSWTGHVVHVADVEWRASGRLAVLSIASETEVVFADALYARAQLHFLLTTYLEGQSKPFPISLGMENEDTGVITIDARRTYGCAGRFGCRLTDYRFD